MIPLTDESIARFWKNVVIGDKNECWHWTGCKINKYGALGINNKIYRAHRISYEIAHGEIPKGFVVCHSCDNPPCINPSHLWVGTQKENLNDAMIKERNVRKISNAQRADILRSEKNNRTLANEYGVNIRSIRAIRSHWKLVTTTDGIRASKVDQSCNRSEKLG